MAWSKASSFQAGIVHRGRIRSGHPARRLGELADITQNWLEARIDRGNVGVVQRAGKHRLIDAEGACDQGMRAMTVPAAIDAGYEGGDELALAGRQRRGPTHQALPVGGSFSSRSA